MKHDELGTHSSCFLDGVAELAEVRETGAQVEGGLVLTEVHGHLLREPFERQDGGAERRQLPLHVLQQRAR